MTEWCVFCAIVALAVTIDLASHRSGGPESRKRAWVWSGAWIGLGAAFGGWILLRDGSTRAAEFFSAYLVEKSLSVDNLLVFLLIFTRLGVPPSERRRVLFWGIAGAVVLRGAFVAAGAVALRRWHFVLDVFGAVLLFIGIRLAVRMPKPDEPRVVRWLRRVLPMTRDLHGRHFVVREDGRLAATPLLVALIAVEVSDILFAVDSIPAVFGVTNDPFLVYASNILAVLGLRALFIAVAETLEALRFIRFGVAAILVFIGGKMIAHRWVELSPAVSIAVIVGALALTAVASGLSKVKQSLPRP